MSGWFEKSFCTPKKSGITLFQWRPESVSLSTMEIIWLFTVIIGYSLHNGKVTQREAWVLFIIVSSTFKVTWLCTLPRSGIFNIELNGSMNLMNHLAQVSVRCPMWALWGIKDKSSCTRCNRCCQWAYAIPTIFSVTELTKGGLWYDLVQFELHSGTF